MDNGKHGFKRARISSNRSIKSDKQCYDSNVFRFFIAGLFNRTFLLVIMFLFISTIETFATAESVECNEYGNGAACITFQKKAISQSSPKRNTSLSSSENVEQQTAHEKKFKRLKHIAELMLEFRNHLQSEQVEYIEVIQKKVVYLFKILDVFNTFYTKGGISKSIIGNIVRMKHKIKIIVKNVILNNSNKSSNDFLKVLSENMRAFVFNLKTQVKNGIRINKRSILQIKESTVQQIKSLCVNRLHLKSEQKSNMNPSFFFASRSRMAFGLNKKINTRRLIVGSLKNNSRNEEHRPKRSTSFDSINHSKIFCNTINNVSLGIFTKGLFKNKNSTFINGNITLLKKAENVFLTASRIDSFEISNLMTISTDQSINSNVYISGILTTDVNARIFNDLLHFADNVVLLGSDSKIESRVEIPICNVENSLKLSDKEGNDMTEHIVGTNMDDLSQIYNGHISIRGSAKMKNILLSSISSALNNQDPQQPVQSQIIINNTPFDLLNLPQAYWFKTTDQITERITFVRPIISPQATITSLNEFPASQYFLLDNQKSSPKTEKNHLFLNFKAEVNVSANLVTNSKLQLHTFVSNTYNRLENAKIKLNAKLTLERAVVNSYASQTFELTSYVRRANFALVHEAKQFKQNMYLRGDVILPNINETTSLIHNLNNRINLSNTLSTIFSVADKRPMVIIAEKDFKAIVVSIENIEDRYMKMEQFNMFSVFHTILNIDEHRIRSMMIDGDVRFTNNSVEFQIPNTLVRMMNLINLYNYFGAIIVKSQLNTKKTLEIAGLKTFISEMNISVSHINEFNKQIQVRDWFSDFLRQQRTEKRAKQLMKNSGWQFTNTISDNFEIAETVNGISFAMSNQSNVVFNQFQAIAVSSDVSFSNNVKMNTKCNCNQLRPCKIDNLAPKTLHLSQSTWDNLGIIGDVKLVKAQADESSSGDTFNFLEGALSSNQQSEDSTVVINITFKMNTGTMFKRINLNGANIVLVNNIDFKKMFNDALLRNESTKRLVSFRSKKHLVAKEIVSSGSENTVFGSISIQLINDVDLNRLDGSIFIGNPKDIYILPWQRILFLNSIDTTAVYVNRTETINGISFEDVHFVYTEISNQCSTVSFENIPSLNYQSPIVAELLINVKTINAFNWNYFIENRFKLKNQFQEVYELFDGYVTFENLVLLGDKVKIDQINDAVFVDIVMRNLDEKQQIAGNKHVKLLQVRKPCHAWKVNSFEFVSMYARTISPNRMQIIDKLVIKYPFLLKSTSISVK